MVQSFFIQNLIDEIESGSAYCKVVSQEELKEYLINTGECDNFPMISYEYTEDSNIDVGIDESKFLNDKEVETLLKPEKIIIPVITPKEPEKIVQFSTLLKIITLETLKSL